MNFLIDKSPTSIFYSKINHDDRILATHISLFMAIHDSWRQKNFAYPIPITRKELMSKSKIKSKATYHKCISNLDLWGYLRYLPSYSPCGSKIKWIIEE